jgi:hypothetical protein
MTARRTGAFLLAMAAMAVLAWRAVDETGPVSASLSLARKFWRATTPTRLLNARPFRYDVPLGAALIGRDRAWPLDADVVLVLPPGVSEGAAEEKRRKAAFVLAPRRVTLERGETGPDGFALRRVARGAP